MSIPIKKDSPPPKCIICGEPCKTYRTKDRHYVANKTCSIEHARLVSKMARETPEAKEKKRLAIIEAYKNHPTFKENNKKHMISIAGLGGHSYTDEQKEEARTHLYGKPRIAPLIALGEQHFLSKFHYLIDPNNNKLEIKNLKHFIRNNEHLFDKEDVQWKPLEKARPSPATGCLTCKAYKNLSNVSRGIVSSWKNWTRYKLVECAK